MLMPEVIADFLQRQALAQQMGGAGAAQGVWPAMGQRNAQNSQTLADNGPQGGGTERANRSVATQENLWKVERGRPFLR